MVLWKSPNLILYSSHRLHESSLCIFCCCQALGVCSQGDRSVLKKKLKEMKKREEKEHRKEEKRLKEETEKEKNAAMDREREEREKVMMEKSVKNARRSGKTVRTESLLWGKDLRVKPPARGCLLCSHMHRNASFYIANRNCYNSCTYSRRSLVGIGHLGHWMLVGLNWELRNQSSLAPAPKFTLTCVSLNIVCEL